MKYLAVKNFAEHQHYRDRIPPWIKFYNRILDDYEFIQLAGAARSHLMLIWLLASRHKNRIPYDVKYIAGAIHARERIDLDAMIGAGWLTVMEEDASAVASTDASKIGDVEESRVEREKEKTPKPRAPRAVVLTPDISTVLEHYCARHPKRRPGPKEVAAIAKALAWGYPPEELCEAVDGNADDDWHAEKGKHALEYVLRNTGMVDDFRAKHEALKPRLAVDPATGLPNELGRLALGGRR